MKKDTAANAATDETPPAEKPPVTTTPAAPAGDQVVSVTDEGAAEGEPQLEPQHEWPRSGGCYVRQPGGTLKRED